MSGQKGEGAEIWGIHNINRDAEPPAECRNVSVAKAIRPNRNKDCIHHIIYLISPEGVQIAVFEVSPYPLHLSLLHQRRQSVVDAGL
jgi:hypothetical protein